MKPPASCNPLRTACPIPSTTWNPHRATFNAAAVPTRSDATLCPAIGVVGLRRPGLLPRGPGRQPGLGGLPAVRSLKAW